MTPSTFISPRNYQTQGGIPRRLLGGVLIVVVSVAMVVYWVASAKQPTARTTDRARDPLADARAIQAQPRGSSRSVDEAAEHAAAASRRAEVAKETASSAARSGQPPRAKDEWSSGTRPVLHPPTGGEPGMTGGWPIAGDDPRAGPPAPADPGASARELDARSSESRIFDEPAGSLAHDGGSSGRSGDRSGWSTPSAGPTDPVVDGLRPAIVPALAPVLPEAAAANALRSFAPPANRNLAQREDEWQERVAGIVGASPPLVARPPAGRLVLEEGTVIPAVLTRRIDSDAPGVITAMVSIDVYDTRTARSLLLPKGSRLVGRYNNDVSTGQQRLQFAFTRLILPDGSSFDLPGAVGSDALGQAGLGADVDRHFFQRFGAALLIGVIADHVVSPRAVPPNNAYGGGLSATGQVLVNTADAELHRGESIAPTLTVPEGTRLNVEVVRDMVFSQSNPVRS